MQEGPRIEKYPIAIQFLGTDVIVMAVSNLQGNIAYGYGCWSLVKITDIFKLHINEVPRQPILKIVIVKKENSLKFLWMGLQK